MSKKSGIVLGLLVVVAVIGAAFYFYNKNLESDKTISFYLPERELLAETADEKEVIKKAETLMSIDGKKVSITYYQQPLLKYVTDKNLKPDKIDAGISDIVQLTALNRAGYKLRPIYTISPNVKFECHSELQVVVHKDSAINSLKDLAGKKVVVVERALRTFNLLSDELEAEKIHFDTIIVKKALPWALENVSNKSVDAMIIPVSVLSNGQVISKMGPMFKGAYEKEPQLRAIKNTEKQLPCRIVFIRETLELSLQEHFIANLNKAFMDSEKVLVMRDLALIGSLQSLPLEKWNKALKVLQDTKEDNISKYATNIVGQ